VSGAIPAVGGPVGSRGPVRSSARPWRGLCSWPDSPGSPEPVNRWWICPSRLIMGRMSAPAAAAHWSRVSSP